MILRKKWLGILILVVSLFVIAACSGNGNDGAEEPDQQENTQEGTEQAEMPQPDLEGIPDVVAEVNGEEITSEEFEENYSGQFQQIAIQYQMSGQELDQDLLKEQIAESMVSSKLLIQEAESRNITATEADIEATLDEIAELNALESKEALFAAFEEQGMSEEEVRSQVETEVKVSQLIVEESGDLEPTEEELQEFYDQTKAQQEQMGADAGELPSFEELKPELAEQLKMQKEQEAAQTIVEGLRKEAEVTIYL
ncbi:SurA N-terminal domain-containing protein [Mesobacillus maritimus]|uniref:SurA N-terminal domain-containing protein n=1 Tax=Mesobacillus maritimus TaxID=1643336 RepID=UPI00384D3632